MTHRSTRRLATLAALLALFAAPPAAFADDAAAKRKSTGISKPVAEKLIAAYALMQEDKYDESLAIVDALAKRRRLKPAEVAQVHRFRGYIFMNKGLSERATAEFEQSLAQNALDPGAEQVMIYSLAQIYTQLGRYAPALALLERFFASVPNPKPDAYYLKAMILVQQEDFDAAVEPATIAVEASPEPRESWLALLVVIHSQRKDFANVATVLERLIALSPGKRQYWLQLAAVQKHLGQEPEALATLQLADHADLLGEDKELRQLARLLFLRQQPWECARVLEAGIAASEIEADAESYRLMANCYLAARENERALGPLAQAGELAPDGEMYLLLGQLHLQREQFGLAVEALDKALAKSEPGERGSVRLLIGVAELGREQFESAERAFKLAHDDAKIRRAAESYLKFLGERRALHEQRQAQQRASSRG